MKCSRVTTSTPGQFISTMNAVIVLGPVRAITTITSATVPLVHQSFSPLRIQWVPSSLSTGGGREAGRIAADAGLGERERGDRALARAGAGTSASAPSVPKSLSGTGTPIDWLAETSAVRLPSTLVIIAIARV